MLAETQVPSSEETLNERLSRYRQIKISVIGRKSGKRISVPVWFVPRRFRTPAGRLYRSEGGLDWITLVFRRDLDHG